MSKTMSKAAFINEAVMNTGATPTSYPASGARPGDGSTIDEKRAAGAAAREYFEETRATQRRLMNRVSHDVPAPLKARAVSLYEKYLEDLGPAPTSARLTAEQTLELLQADKFSPDSIEMLMALHVEL